MAVYVLLWGLPKLTVLKWMIGLKIPPKKLWMTEDNNNVTHMKTKAGRADASLILVWLSYSLLTSRGKYSIIRCKKTLKNEKLSRRLFAMWITIFYACPIKVAKIFKTWQYSLDKSWLEPSYIVGGNLKGTTTLENHWIVSYKVKYTLPCDTAIPFLGI